MSAFLMKIVAKASLKAFRTIKSVLFSLICSHFLLMSNHGQRNERLPIEYKVHIHLHNE